MKVRRLNSTGINRMIDFLDSLKSDNPQKYPEEILTSKETSEETEVEVEIDEKIVFENRFEIGKYFFEKLGEAGFSNIEADKGLWAWLSLVYFEQLCPKNKSGKHEPREQARWIPDPNNFRKYYRHLLAGPFRIYKAHSDQPECTLSVLQGKPGVPGEIAEQISASQEYITNREILKLATSLYIDPENKTAKRGSGGKGGGAPRRLTFILNQFDLVWDLYSMTSEDLLKLMPQEFNKFTQTTN